MRILIVTQIFLPEMGALANRLYPIVRELVSDGHEVFVATGMPNYPSGKIFPGFRGRFFMREKKNGYTILRTAYLTVARNKSKFGQLLSYLTFLPAVFVSGMRAGRVDAVVITSPPIFPVIPASLLARIRGAKLVSDIRDLWSDELVTYVEMNEESLPVRMARWLERFGYRKSNLVACTTHSLIETVTNRGALTDKTVYLPNGADLEIFKPLPAVNDVSEEYGFGDRFVVMYSGLFGIKHGLEILLKAAETLRERKDIVFFLLGNGARREHLENYVKENSLDNVIVGGEREIHDIPKIIARADVCFASVRPEPYPKKLISVKIFEYLACEKPVIGAVNGESEKLIRESGGGIVVEPGDDKATADAILKFYQNPELRKEMGRKGREYVEANFSRSAWASKFVDMLVQLTGKTGAGVSLKTIETYETESQQLVP